MPAHRLYLDLVIPPPGERLTIAGDEAVHAIRVKRLECGETVELLDGRGTVAQGTVDRLHPGRSPELVILIEASREVPPVRPSLHVWAATPKGGRVDELVDALSQVGAAGWTPLRTERSVVSPRDAKLDRLRRIAVESAKQSGRAWLMEIAAERPLAEALDGAGRAGGGHPEDRAIVIADAGGDPYRPTGAASLTLLVGPEGGWSPTELAAARDAGAIPACIGPHTMRIETAAIAAAAVILHAENGHR